MGFVRVLAAAVAVGAVAWFGFARLGGEVALPGLPNAPSHSAVTPSAIADGVDASPATSTGESIPVGSTDAPERRFALALDAAAAQAGELVRLGETKSRNLPGILAEQRRMNALLEEIDALVASGSLPPEAAEAIVAYEAGATAVRDAMEAAQAGFRKLDFGAVRAATDRMREGERDLVRAAALFD